MRFLETIQKIPKRKLVLGSVISLMTVLVIGIFIWSAITGKIKFFAATLPPITNTATVTYTPTGGTPVTINSNTVSTEIGSTLVGDLDNSGTIDIYDFRIMKDNWEPANGSIADLDASGTVDIYDFRIMKDNWTN